MIRLAEFFESSALHGRQGVVLSSAVEREEPATEGACPGSEVAGPNSQVTTPEVAWDEYPGGGGLRTAPPSPGCDREAT